MNKLYQQVLLDEKSRQYMYVTINTHLGLFHYMHLPFRVAASPAIFQQTMDSILSGLNGVGGILDDLILTGPNDKEHLRNLENTLKRLDSMGVKVERSKWVYSGVFCACGGPAWNSSFTTQDTSHPRSSRAAECNLELKSFLGLVNYYGKFIREMSTLVHPLNCLLLSTHLGPGRKPVK